MKRIISLILCLIMVAACFVSCVDEETEIADGTTEAPAPQILDLVVGGASSYEIIYPEQSTQQEANFIKTFTELFNEKTGIKLPKKDDFLKAGESRDADTCKIYIGATNHPMAQETYKNLQYQDFRIITSGSNIILTAFTNTGYSGILRWFKKNVFEGYTGGDLSMEAVDIQDSEIVGYPVSKWTINGNQPNKYTIVYDDPYYAERVGALREAIAKKTGWYLEIGLDESTPESEYEILIGETNRADTEQIEKPDPLNYSLTVNADKLIVRSGGMHSEALLLESFCDFVFGDKKELIMDGMFEQTGNFYDDPCDSSIADGTDLRIMTANVLADTDGYNEIDESEFPFDRRKEIFYSALEYYQPTVVGLQEFCMSYHKAFDEYEHKDKWEILRYNGPKMKQEYVYSTIMFRKDLYTLIDSGMTYYSKYNNGRCRCITWAILEDKASKQQFCFVSTHWDGADTDNTMKQVEELTSFVNGIVKDKGIPVFTTGDFNSNEWTKAMKNFLADTNSYDCMHADESVRQNVEGSWHDWGNPTSSTGSCDHITSTKADTVVLKFQTLMYNEQIWGSDHAWLYADIKFK